MKAKTLHYEPISGSGPACNQPYRNKPVTANKEIVTCVRCRRTKAFTKGNLFFNGRHMMAEAASRPAQGE